MTHPIYRLDVVQERILGWLEPNELFQFYEAFPQTDEKYWKVLKFKLIQINLDTSVKNLPRTFQHFLKNHWEYIERLDISCAHKPLNIDDDWIPIIRAIARDGKLRHLTLDVAHILLGRSARVSNIQPVTDLIFRLLRESKGLGYLCTKHSELALLRDNNRTILGDVLSVDRMCPDLQILKTCDRWQYLDLNDQLPEAYQSMFLNMVMSFKRLRELTLFDFQLSKELVEEVSRDNGPLEKLVVTAHFFSDVFPHSTDCVPTDLCDSMQASGNEVAVSALAYRDLCNYRGGACRCFMHIPKETWMRLANKSPQVEVVCTIVLAATPNTTRLEPDILFLNKFCRELVPWVLYLLPTILTEVAAVLEDDIADYPKLMNMKPLNRAIIHNRLREATYSEIIENLPELSQWKMEYGCIQAGASFYRQ